LSKFLLFHPSLCFYFQLIATKQTWKRRLGNRQEARSESKVPRNKCSPHGGNLSWILSRFPEKCLKICKALRVSTLSLQQFLSRSAKNQPPEKIQNSVCRVLPIFLLGNYVGVLRVRILLISSSRCFPFSARWAGEGAEHNCSSRRERGRGGARIRSIFHAPAPQKSWAGARAKKKLLHTHRGKRAQRLLGLGLLSLCIGVCCGVCVWRVCICLRCVNLKCSIAHTPNQGNQVKLFKNQLTTIQCKLC